MRAIIETERLILRNVTPDDYEACFKWCGDPEVTKYMIYPCYKCAEDVKTWLETLDPDNPNLCDLGFVLKETGELIGMGGIAYSEKCQVWKVGYNIRKNMWGNGYAPEAIRGIIDYVGSFREISAIEGEFAVDNSKSRRVMEKLGMTYVRDSHFAKFDGSAEFDSKIYRREFKQ